MGDGLKESTLRQINYKLRELARNVNMNDPEAVKRYMATAKNRTTNEELSDETRNKFAYAFASRSRSNPQHRETTNISKNKDLNVNLVRSKI